MAVNIESTKAPVISLTPTQFSQQHFDLLHNQLRLYFNTLDRANAQSITEITTLATPSSGTTAARPTIDLQVGQFYFDTTITRPIWWTGTNWINAAGTVV
jgi:hypothetical protein